MIDQLTPAEFEAMARTHKKDQVLLLPFCHDLKNAVINPFVHAGVGAWNEQAIILLGSDLLRRESSAPVGQRG